MTGNPAAEAAGPSDLHGSAARLSDSGTVREWLEADGLGGFASGVVAGPRTRRYHALLLASTRPPADRFVLVNGFDAWVETGSGAFPISTQGYSPDVEDPRGHERLSSFASDPWPRWTFTLPDWTVVEQELFVRHEVPVTCLRWKLLVSTGRTRLTVRWFLSGRHMHELHHENDAFRFEPEAEPGHLLWFPYPGVPGIGMHHNGAYDHEPAWYRNFLYREERARGLDFREDLAAPGKLSFDLSAGDAFVILSAEGLPQSPPAAPRGAAVSFEGYRRAELKRRAAFPSKLHRAASAYLVRRGRGRTLIAGYPWFTDWGRDTFIALRGICITGGVLQEAREILIEWSGAISQGMLPNHFPDRGERPEYNSVDASLWYVVAVHDFLQAIRRRRARLGPADARRLKDAVEAILQGYSQGTRYGIAADRDGLLRCGESGVQLTWMDARVGDHAVTPRIGKPVEVQALWLNALAVGSAFTQRWEEPLRRGREAFEARFWNPEQGCLYDVVDAEHRPGVNDPAFRPNQIYAVGGLPLPLLQGEKARQVVSAVASRLLTPLGLRSLAPGESGYAARYQGGVRERDGAYHQGTVWPYLMGPFVEAWVRVHGGSSAAISEARDRYLNPLLAHLDSSGIGHLPELADAEPPHAPRGCPFQAWSVGEALRLEEQVLSALQPPAARPRRPAGATPPVPQS
jgi:predicted glycogen debranching enzyme